MAKQKFKRGDIITVCLNPVIERELQGEQRPVLVLSESKFHECGFMMIAPITQGNAELARKKWICSNTK
ncbi:type II toxin-antitoxin system PemK/MazF family toxin [Mergibacter septicus]|uniref:type II toxin-antitoxin system PemK/MazF family toxin n=1 Tax=Mergibacter septicus TaxID=221402 RepID=UPI002240893B|nr:type II toxin-antitoxin system PemK/MazF family toxin [Mergibacter septicus]